MGLWWYFCSAENKRIEAYLQLEESRLCFKICVTDETASDEERDAWKNKWIDVFCRTGKDFNVVRPRVVRRGTYMTVAILNGDYRVAKADGCIDVVKTIEKLRTMEKVLVSAVEANQ